MTPAIATLTAKAHHDLEALSHPSTSWVPSERAPDGQPVLDAVIVGGGQSGIIVAAALQREGLKRIMVVDRAPTGEEGPWTTFARMPELRTPKALVGSDLGIPSLSVRRWFEATHGPGSWEHIDRIPTADWRCYLDWFRSTMGVAVQNDTTVVDIRPHSSRGDLAEIDFECRGERSTRCARAIVLTTGFDGAGAWRVPSFVSDRLPLDRYDHSNTEIDMASLRGKRVGILGHGASAFDNAKAAVEAGAESVDICFRRDRLPRTNPHRHIETAGLMTHYPELSAETRWQIAQYFRSNDQPPPDHSFRRAMELNKVTLRPSTPWIDVGPYSAGDDDNGVWVTTPHGRLQFDHLILATGGVIDPSARPELAHIEPLVRHWSDIIDIDDDDHDPSLGALPDLDHGYAFQPVDEADAWVRRVFAFNQLSYVSQGPHSTSISGHRHALPRLVRGVTRQLFIDQRDRVLPDLKAFVSDDLSIGEDYEEQCRLENDDAIYVATTA